MTDRPLTGKQQAFVNAYIACGFNATEAARRAGYSGDDTAMRVTGYDNLAKPHIRAEIDKLLSAQVMSRDEVLTRLSDHARASLEDFMDEHQVIDLEAAKKRGKLQLAKKIKSTRKTYQDETTETLEVELHDPQAALVQLGRHYRLFVDRVEIEVPAEILKLLPDVLRVFGTPERASEAFRRLVQEANKAQQPVQVTPATPEGGADV